MSSLSDGIDSNLVPEIHKRQWQEDKQVEIANGADLSGETYGNNNVVVETCVQNIQSYG